MAEAEEEEEEKDEKAVDGSAGEGNEEALGGRGREE